MTVMAMFPLGTVLLPLGLLPLQVFEPRYQALAADVVAGAREFGVTLIERGSEVGGGDVRTMLGTVARVHDAMELPDGRWYLNAAGSRRIRVLQWLPDDPYPMADVMELPDMPPGPEADALCEEASKRLRRVLSLRVELGEPGPPPTVTLDPDPVAASWQIAVLAGLGPLDAQNVLAQPGADGRLRLLHDLLDHQAAILEFRLGD